MSDPNPDPVYEDADATAIAAELFEEFADTMAAQGRFAEVAYRLWIELTRYLAGVGWKAEELAFDAMRHATDQTTEGSA
jgi:hypothetical protein